MKPGEAVVVERTANGWIVRSWPPPNQTWVFSDFRVFNEMGYASSPGDQVSRPCLLKFIEEHFADKPA